MERLFLFKTGMRCVLKDLIIYMLQYFSLSERLTFLKVSKRMHFILINQKVIHTMVRVSERLRGVTYSQMLNNKSCKIENILAEEMCFQSRVKHNFDLDDWKELQEVIIHIMGLKLKKVDKVEMSTETNQKTLFYFKESLSIMQVTPKSVSMKTSNITKYTSKILSTMLSLGKLTEMDFTKCHFTKIGFKSLIQIFTETNFNSDNPLKKLILKRCELGDKRIKDLLFLLMNKPNLIYLDLTNNRIETEPFIILSKHSNNFFFKNLKLDFNELTSKGVYYLSQFLDKNKLLKKISLVNSIINEKSFYYLNKVLSVSLDGDGINKISFGLNNISDPTANLFTNALKLNNSIRSIKIFFWEFTYNGLKNFMDYLSDPKCKLEKLILCAMNFSENFEMFEILINNMINNQSVTMLKLPHCDLGSKHINLLSKLLHMNKQITHLDLRENFISELEVSYLKQPNQINQLSNQINSILIDSNKRTEIIVK